jgi:hypothetical protein
VQDVDAGGGLELLAVHVGGAADAREAKRDPCRLRLGLLDEVADRLPALVGDTTMMLGWRRAGSRPSGPWQVS